MNEYFLSCRTLINSDSLNGLGSVALTVCIVITELYIRIRREHWNRAKISRRVLPEKERIAYFFELFGYDF